MTNILFKCLKHPNEVFPWQILIQVEKQWNPWKKLMKPLGGSNLIYEQYTKSI